MRNRFYIQPVDSFQVPRFRATFEVQLRTNLTIHCISDSWPVPPALSLPQFDVEKCIVFQLYIDSGGGATKLMGRFIRSDEAQSSGDIILLAEAHAINEEFFDLNRMFGLIGDEVN